MGKYRIIIEGEGPHHSGKDAEEGAAVDTTRDANKVANDTVLTLVALGHKVETADFEYSYDDATASFADGESLAPEPVAEVAAVEGEKGDPTEG
jgi:hypothetical protein